MPIRQPPPPARGRPKGARSFDERVATAFGTAVRSARRLAGVSQEALALRADIERSYLGRIERGQSQPTLHALLKIATALELEGSELVATVEQGLRKRRRAAG